MSLATEKLDSFITEQVEKGVYSSTKEAEKKVISALIEKEEDRMYTQSIEDYNNGNYQVMTEETNAQYMQKLAEKILPKHHA